MKQKPGLDGPRVPHNPLDILLRPEKKLLRAAGSLLSSSPCTVISLFLSVVDHVDNTGGRRRGERTKAEDDGEASDGNEQEPRKITASRGRREQAVPPALVWLWRLEEEETEETRQTLNVNPTVKVGTIVC